MLLHEKSCMKDPRCKHEYLDKPKPVPLMLLLIYISYSQNIFSQNSVLHCWELATTVCSHYCCCNVEDRDYEVKADFQLANKEYSN